MNLLIKCFGAVLLLRIRDSRSGDIWAVEIWQADDVGSPPSPSAHDSLVTHRGTS
jgi:hypothetical protein